MGDFRVSVDVSIAGRDGKTHTMDWWVNWSESVPSRVAVGINELAEKAGLWTEYLGGSEIIESQRKEIDELIELLNKHGIEL